MSEGRPGEPGRAPGPPPPAVPGGVSVALLAPRSEQGRAGSRWGRLGSCCPCRVGSRGLLHPLSSRTSLGREGRGCTGCHGARRVGGPAPGGSGAPRAPRGGPPRPGTRPQSRQQSRAGGKFPLALCPGTLGAAVPTWAGGSRGQGPGSHSTGSQRGLANRPPTQTQEPLCSGGRQRGAGGTEARGGSEAAAPSRADGASSPRAEPRVPGTLRGAGGCRSSRSPHKGASSSAVGRGWPRVCSRGLLATLGGACQGLALSEEGPRRGGSSVCTGIVAQRYRVPRVRRRPGPLSPPLPDPQKSRVSTATVPGHVTETVRRVWSWFPERLPTNILVLLLSSGDSFGAKETSRGLVQSQSAQEGRGVRQ